jgi:hypothetical protein
MPQSTQSTQYTTTLNLALTTLLLILSNLSLSVQSFRPIPLSFLPLKPSYPYPTHLPSSMPDDSPSDSSDDPFYSPASSPPPQQSSDSSTKDVQGMVSNLLSACEDNNAADRSSIQALINNILKVQSSISIPSMSTVPLLGGRWSLLYSSTDPTRSSPFFPAFANAAGKDAGKIFQVTDRLVKEEGKGI